MKLSTEPHKLEIQHFADGSGFEVQNSDFTTPASPLLRFLEKRAGVVVKSKLAWALTDDFFADFEYRGELFLMSTPFVLVWIESDRRGCETLLHELADIVSLYRRPSMFSVAAAIARYSLKPFRPAKSSSRRRRSGAGTI